MYDVNYILLADLDNIPQNVPKYLTHIWCETDQGNGTRFIFDE